jgi:hypothetical protein
MHAVVRVLPRSPARPPVVLIASPLVGLASSVCGPEKVQPFRPLDPSLLANKILDLAASLIVVLFGFFLLNVCWNRREQRRKASPLEHYLLTQIEYIGRLVHESIMALLQGFAPSEYEPMAEIDRVVEQNIDKLYTISQAVVASLEGSGDASDRAKYGFRAFRTHMEPDIDDLKSRCGRELRPQTEEMLRLLGRLGRNAQELGSYLRGDKDDFSPRS